MAGRPISLFLAALARETGDDRYADTVLVAPGAVGGRSGLGPWPGPARRWRSRRCVLLASIGGRAGRPRLHRAAELRLRRLLAGAPALSISCTAPPARSLGSLAVHAVTRDDELLSDARTAGDQLVATALAAPDGGAGCYWEVPWERARRSRHSLPRLVARRRHAHGPCPRQLGLVTADERYLQVAASGRRAHRPREDDQQGPELAPAPQRCEAGLAGPLPRRRSVGQFLARPRSRGPIALSPSGGGRGPNRGRRAGERTAVRDLSRPERRRPLHARLLPGLRRSAVACIRE